LQQPGLLRLIAAEHVMAQQAASLSFEAIHHEFRPKVLRYLAGFVGSDEAGDLTQITMLKVSEHLAHFRGEASLATWIYRIATNVAFDRLRQRSPEIVPLECGLDEESAERVPPALQVDSAEAAAARLEMNGCLREFIEQLPAHERTVLLLSDIEGLSNDEIAVATGVTLATVKIRLHRGRARLRERLRSGCTVQRDERNEVACDRRRVAA
jgi:RNA polymerase sigma-70 factor, ECF subfamily